MLVVSLYGLSPYGPGHTANQSRTESAPCFATTTCRRDRLSATLALSADGGQPAADQGGISLGLRWFAVGGLRLVGGPRHRCLAA